MKKVALFLGLVILVVSVVVALANPVWKETEISRFVPLPRNINIIPPSADLPKEIAAFSGRWEGIWDSRELKSVFVVEKIDSKKAKIIYGWSSYGSVRADYVRDTMNIVLSDAKPKLESITQHNIFSFEMCEDLKTIRGIRTSRQGLYSNSIIMKKVED